MTQRYPLQWPAGRPRRDRWSRRHGQFKVSGAYVTISDAFARVEYELDRVGGKNAVISTNLELRVNGLPRMDRPQPEDPGVCLYFDLKGKPYALACDTFTAVAQNIAAIAAHLEATRAIERHGVATTAEMFTAFEALPPPRTWWQTLGFSEVPHDPQDIDRAWRDLARKNHPDQGGSSAAMAALNAARDEGRRAITAI